MFNYWKHSSSPSPAKQYPANISSRHHLTDGNIKISWGLLEKKVGGRGGVSKGTADCYHHETFSKNSNMPGNYNCTRTQDKYCFFTDCTWQNVLFSFVKEHKGLFYFSETIKRLWKLLPTSRVRTSYTLLSYKNLIRGGKQIWRCSRSGKTKTHPEAGSQ